MEKKKIKQKDFFNVNRDQEMYFTELNYIVYGMNHQPVWNYAGNKPTQTEAG